MQVESQTNKVGTTIVLQTDCTTKTMCATIPVYMKDQLELDKIQVFGACVASLCEHVDLRGPGPCHGRHTQD